MNFDAHGQENIWRDRKGHAEYSFFPSRRSECLGKGISEKPIEFLPKSHLRQENWRREKADVAQECVKMSGHKDKWYEPYKIVSTLGKGETKKRIESKIALGSSISLEGYLFYGKEIDRGKYRLHISHREIFAPQGGAFNPNLPRVVLEIISDFDGCNITLFWIKPRIFWNSIPLVFYTFFCIDRRVNILIYTFFLCLGVFLFGKYWEFVRRRVGEWLEEILGVKKETEE